MKMSGACSGMLSTENNDFKFLKTAKKQKMHVHYVHNSSRARVTCFISPNQLVVDQKHVTVAKGQYYIFFPKYRKFDTGNCALTLSIYLSKAVLY